ncbi:hypothetical protein JK356_08035 [Streptomyces sp. 7-21]|nr:hypothetical protein [Streptomyces sp. 7-21]
MRPPSHVLTSAADQGAAALTNIAVVVVTARQVPAGDFASFAIAYAVFTLLLGAFTAFIGQALVLRGGPGDEPRRHCRAAAVFTLAASAAAGVLLAATAPLSAATGALGAVLPVLLTQDGLRYAFSLLRRPGLALATDTLRLAVTVPVLAAQPAGAGPGRMVLAWGLSALPALLLGAALLAYATRGAGAGAWRPDTRTYLARRYLGRRFLAEFGVGNAASQTAIIGVGVLGSSLAVGALRGATTLFGPVGVLFNAVTGFGPPQLAAVPGAARKARAAAMTGLALAALAACWALLLSLLPDAAGREVLGETWGHAAELLPATGTQYAAMALGTCGLLALRVLCPRATLGVQVVFSVLSVALLLGGYALGGVTGAAWGLALGSAAKAAAAWARVTFEVRVSR